MNKKYRHIVMNGNRLRSVLMAAMLLMSGTAMADETGGVRVGGSVYGGGNLAKVAGSCTVNINQEGAVVTNDVYGGGAKAHVNTSDGTTATEGATTTVTLTKGTVGGSVYGGGLGQQERAAQAATESSPAVEAQEAIPANVFGTVKVTVNGGTAQNVFGCNNLNGSPQQDVTVNIDGGTINEDVYGGGHEADALGQITVNIKGGTVKRDVYGGGALASTNTSNWDVENNTWVDATNTSAVKTTTVNLTGGKIGNAYGGGLGDTNTPAYVWGDVTIEVNGTAFTQEVEQNVTNEDETPISKTGRVFGCNNVKGSPKGHVVVNVRRTVEGDVKRTEEDDLDSEDATKHKYEIAAVYGGGNLAAYEPVSESEATEVHIYGCENTSIYQVYGGGNAASTPATVVNIHETYEIGEVFGGGNGKDKIYLGNEWTKNPGANVGYKEYAEGTSYEDRNSSTYTYGTGRAQVNVGGGKIHYVFGGSNTKGNVREIAVAMLEEIKNGDTPVCKFDVDEAYGGGKSAEMDGRAMLDVGCIPGLKAVYGGAMNAPVNNDASLRIINGNFGKVYGGNNLGGSIKGSVTVEIEEVGCNAINIDELYGGGNNAAYSVEDINTSRTDFDFEDETAENYYKNYPLVKIISATSIGKVFGGGDNADVTGNPHVLIDMVAGVLNSNNDIENDESTKADNVTQELGKIGQVFGGGNNAGVTGSTYINFVKGQIKKIVTTPASEGVTEVAIMPGIYGGCNTKGTVSDNTHVVLSGVPTETQTIAEIGATGASAEICGGGLGEETVVEGTAHVNLGSVTPGTEGADDTYSGSASVIGDIYGGSAFGEVKDTEVNLYSLGTESTPFSGNIFGGGKGSYTANATSGNIETKVTGNATVNLVAATVAGSIYGGCNVNGTVEGGTVVTLIGGQVGTDATHTANVFGGGYGHNTYVKGDVKVNVGEDRQSTGGTTIYGDVYGGSAQGYVNAYLKTTTVGETTSTSVDYSTNNSTTVNLNAGIIYGDAYGGGLGQKTGFDGATADVAAEVGGAVNVNVQGVAFKISNYTDEGHTDVVKTGRVFGCNNLYGSPKGNVTVTVSKTVGLNDDGTINSTKPTKENGSYEIAAVYGGGNLAPYEASGKKAHVIIRGCNDISIQTVYGGGNAAAVPESDVDIYSAYEIGSVFGGGNGKDMYKTDAEWVENAGANVNGPANTLIYGGTIHEAYGGSNEKGAIAGTVTIDISGDNPDECPLDVAKVVGAGKNADVNGDMIAILGCKPETKIPLFYAGADNANVNGNVELTITSGNFGRVFGGNNEGGVIKGHIKVNIEETGNCGTPITIDELYLGGNEAAYSIYGYYQDASDDNKLKPRTAEMYRITDSGDENYRAAVQNPSNADGKHPFPYDEPVLNVISCTRIGKIYGGGYGVGGDMHANPTVNINMIPGSNASAIKRNGSANEHDLGEIGDVYGGGDAADVYGNTTINIGTEPTVTMTSIKDEDGELLETQPSYNVEGAYITGNIYGGGNKAAIHGSTEVNICARKMEQTEEGVTTVNYQAVNYTGTDYEGVHIEKSGSDYDNSIVFGGGNEADVTGNTTVRMMGGYVKNRIYGGGNLGSVGTYTADTNGKPETWTTGTGTSTVEISGGEVGLNGMSMPDDWGHVFGAGRGRTGDISIFGNETIPNEAYVDYTNVTISGTAWVKGSVYGGSENGHVRHDTQVTISGGQIGEGQGMGRVYNDTEWGYDGSSDDNSLKECASWTYGKAAADADKYAPYDPNANANGYYDDSNTLTTEGGRPVGDDGHTFYGNVFGGGSGYYPYAAGKWLESAGLVEGDTHVTINGGHILTSVYGGNEMTNVGTGLSGTGGKCYITMTDGTIGVPRTEAQIQAHPVTCNLFGAGKGDQRVFFNKSTNVKEVEISVTGGTIYGSVFGGGEDGHVQKDVSLTIGGTAKVGTFGYSGFDGNVFGGGRGFSGDALTAGNVAGCVNLEVSGGHVLGSVYGGGRLASVGYGLFPSTGDDRYGTMRPDNKDDDESNTAVSDFKRGYVNVTISGNAVIGNDTESTLTHTKGGNVYGGSMGRLTLLDGSINDLWPKLARVKEATVTVSGGTINGNVYGGGELGTVTTNTKVEVTSGSGTVNRNIFGGGYGSDDYTTTTDGYTPMQLAGRVDGTATVDIKGGWVKKNVYGGGEMASVGIMTLGEKHESETTSFALSWPYASSYANTTNGNTYVTVTGGRIGMTGKDKMGNKNDKGKDIKEDNGDVYGAGKGIAGDRYIYANCANVNNATVLINYGSTPNPPVATTEDSSDACIAGSVYGGGENGHVIGNANLTMQGGLVGHALYGGGKGKDTYTTTLRVKDASGKKPGEEGYTETTGDVDIYSITAGKVYGKTTVTMSGGRVVRNIYGGGNMASVGKGNYSGGSDDYTSAGYGETITGELWTNTDFMNSGKSTVTISSGTVGAVQTELAEGEDDMKDDLIFGNVFGGCRGESAPNVSQTLSPRIHYYPEFYVGYVNETQVNIQSNAKILGSVYGGGQDGHVRRGTQVNIEGGTIGLAFTDDNRNYLGKNKKGEWFKITSDRWQQRGNVYGSGSGIGQYDTGEKDSDGEAIMAYSYSAGSVTQSTEVNITGGTVYKDVYGGGSLSTVGPPKIRQTAEPTKLQTLNTVNIGGGTVGEATGYATGYGGNVYGASRGYSDLNLDQTIFTTTMFTEVNMKSGQVLGSLFGGGEVGIVKGSVNVNVTGGTVGHDVYGGGALADTNTNNPTDADGKLTSTSTYTTTVNLLGGTVGNAYGGGLGDSNTEALVFGDVQVDLNGTTAITTDATGNKVYTSTPNDPTKKGCVVEGYVFGANNVNGTPKGHVLVHVHGTQNENTDDINNKVEGDYDVKGVFGGGNAADYVPAESDTEQSTEVIIEGCELTSIEEVYGGGFGAATPGTNVLIKGTKIINNVFGGGYGAGNHDDPTASDYNPGANVGYRSNGTTSYGLSDGGKSVIQLMAGTVNHVYGGSNTKGDIRGGSDVTNVTNDGGEGCCTELSVEEIYGGGKSADMFGGAEICLSCMPNDWIGAIYAGAESANVENDVSLTLTSGKFEQVFGGNKSGGEIGGFVEVNIEENPDCSTPIIIGELYGGGNEAAYTYSNLDSDPTYQSPRVNVRAFTSIGTIYGGGKGAKATVTGNPMVNINVVEGGRTYAGETKTVDGTKVTIYDRSNDSKMGAIGNVFGGGNAAPVNGNTYVNIATEEYVQMNSVIAGETDVRGYYTRSRSGQGTEADPYVYTYTKVESDTEEIADDTTVYYKPVLGADIRGNVYGGGNAAEVTGKTNVVIGQRIDN